MIEYKWKETPLSEFYLANGFEPRPQDAPGMQVKSASEQ